MTSTRFNPHPSVLPAVAVPGNGSLVAEWTQLMDSDPKHFSEDVHGAASRDLGSTWTTPVRVNRDNTESDQSLVSIAAGEKESDIIWLDGRNAAQNGEFELVHTSVDGFGSLAPIRFWRPESALVVPLPSPTLRTGLLWRTGIARGMKSAISP